MIRLGGPVTVASDDPREIAQTHEEWGYTAAYCPDVRVDDGDRIRAIRDAFAERNIVIAEVGAWGNMIPPDEAARQQAIDYVSERLAVADEVGALCCVDYAGTRRPGADHGAHPDNFTADTFDLIVQTVQQVIDSVNPRRAKFCLEMMQTVPPDSVDSYLALINAIDRKAFAVHLDPVNIFYEPRTCFQSVGVIKDCVARLGPCIVSCHAKDFVIRDGLSVHIDECRPGTGLLDYAAYIAGLRSLGRDIPLMLEHLDSEDEYRQASEFVRSVIS